MHSPTTLLTHARLRNPASAKKVNTAQTGTRYGIGAPAYDDKMAAAKGRAWSIRRGPPA